MGIQINGNTNNINAGIGSLSIEDIHELDLTGIATASNFKTGVSNLHNVGLTLSGGQIDVGSNIKIGTAGVITATSFVGSGANLTGLPAGVTINNNANNRIITGSGTANTLEGESGLTFDGSTLSLTPASSNAGRVTIFGSEGQDARLSLISDEGDDHIDQYNLRVAASNNRFYIDQFESGAFQERFTIANGGNIGIGTDNPAKKLEVFDTTQGVIRIRGGAGGSNSSRKADLSLFASGAREYVVRADASDAEFKIIDVTGSNAERFTILSNGRVGINTSTTNRQLMINDESGGGIGVQGSNAGIYMGTHATNGFQSNCAIARAGASNYHISGSSVGDFCIAGESTKDIIFGTSVNAGAMAERLRITHDGNIGIGNRTSSPDQLLHVHTSSGDAVIHVEAGADPKLRLRAHSGESIIQFADGSSSNTGEINYVHSEDYLKFRVNGSERLRINNAGITTFYKVPELDTTPTSGHNSTAGTFGFAVQRSFVRNVTAGNVANFCDYYATEGNMALMIQISSDTGGNSGTATYFWYGGFLPSSGYGDHWHRIFPAHVGYGHGNGADTGMGNSTAWELLIGGAGVTGSNYRIRVACHVPSGKTNKNIVCTITELRRGMQFYNKSSDALYAFSGQTDSGSDAINKMWSNSFVVSNSSDSTNYNFREIYLSGNQHLYFANGANQAYLHLNGSWTNASDIAYKKDIEDITYGIDTVKKLKPRKYKHKGTNDDDIGFIAQEIESVVPEVVSGDDGSKGVSYGNLTATLTKALQELIAKVETLEQENKDIRNRLMNLEG